MTIISAQLQEKIGIIYVATSKTTGKNYVGQTFRSLEDRIAEHKRASRYGWRHYPFYHDAMRYGWDDFEWAIYCRCPANELNSREMEAVEFYHSFPEGYNLTKGGAGILGRKHSENTKQKISQHAKNRPPEYKRKLSEARKGKKLPNETKRKISETLKGNNNAKGHTLTEKQKKAIACHHIGKPLTEQHKAKLSEAFKGRIFTEEWKAKIGAANSHPITINGITYPSHTKARQALGISAGTFYRRVKCGYYRESMGEGGFKTDGHGSDSKEIQKSGEQPSGCSPYRNYDGQNNPHSFP